MISLHPEQKNITHIAIIPDGNRRWARREGLAETEGHTRCFSETTPPLLEHLWKQGVHTVTLWMFSTDNWNRKRNEVNHLMLLFKSFLDEMEKMTIDLGISMVHVGRKDRIPSFLRDKVEESEMRTALNKNGSFVFALDYSGRDELQRALQKLDGFPVLDEGMDFARLLDTTKLCYPDPDIIIRTSGEVRTSGFMPWQSAHSEYFFLDKYYPDLNIRDLDQVISSFYKRNRRYGR